MTRSILQLASLPITYASTLLSKATTTAGLRRRSQLTEPSKSLSAFERLPPEILLTIRDMLDGSAQLLLGLTCKYLYSVMARPLDPTLYTTKERIIISKYLEIDSPEHLTCQVCGALFRWRQRARLSYSCPVGHRAPREYIPGKAVAVKAPSSIYINFETRDLVLRYYERGPHTGISAGWLNQNGQTLEGIPLVTKARWSCEQLVVFTQWTLEPELMQGNGRIWNWVNTCYHTFLSRKVCLTRKQFLEQIGTTQRCPYCACDVEFSQQVLADNSVRVIVRSWCNYGNSRSEDLSIQQRFRSRKVVRIDQDIVAKRNLRELFDRGEDATNEKEIGNPGETLEQDKLRVPKMVCTPQ